MTVLRFPTEVLPKNAELIGPRRHAPDAGAGAGKLPSATSSAATSASTSASACPSAAVVCSMLALRPLLGWPAGFVGGSFFSGNGLPRRGLAGGRWLP